LPLLGASKHPAHAPGRIINVSSVSGRVAYPFLGAYAASKHALEAISDAFRRELLWYGIDVILIEPGTVDTSLRTTVRQQLGDFADTDYGPLLTSLGDAVDSRESSALPVGRVAEVIRTALESRRPRTRYHLPRRRLMGWLLLRLPDRWFDRLIARRLGLR
jgi:NAD(P)-dependent dehydrogenase (short-subunit alcohol dehydrogenase family)